MSDGRMLNVVNEEDEVIGEETREKVHQDGLLHREIHIFFITPQKEIILQHRAKDKDTYPDLLDATVGGHVEIGDDYISTAVKEAKEETGFDIDKEKLVLLKKMRKETFDNVTGLTNNTIRSQYGYLYEGNIDDLEVEEGKAIGFEAWNIDKLKNLTDQEKERLIPVLLEEEYMNLFEDLKKLCI